ncbi:MAG: AsnC family transcriptional regulator, partial [Candidatus Thorarchaeota archaeon]
MSRQRQSPIDETDLKILELLQEDCKLGVQKISQ